jgi:hypothetical protein
VRSSTSTVVVVNPALFRSDGASVGSAVSLHLINFTPHCVGEWKRMGGHTDHW